MTQSETDGSFLVVATLLVRREFLAEFREFERAAARVMTRYGGRIREAVFVDSAASSDAVKEIHVVRFPDRLAFEAYRGDPELSALAPLRERSILSTELEFGVAVTSYAG